MATDATGVATNPDGIPTYNTSVDAPSGLGFNAAMAAIQTALSNRPKAPAGIAAGEAMVWNGASWDRSSVTRIGSSSLGSGGGGTGTKFLADDQTFKTLGGGTEIVPAQQIAADTSTSSSAFVDLVIFAAGTFANVKHYLEIVIPNLRNTASAAATAFQMMEGAATVGNPANVENHATVANGVSVFIRQSFTPTAGAHTYKVQWNTQAASTSTIKVTGLVAAEFRIVQA